jgi:putative oxidoreductase
MAPFIRVGFTEPKLTLNPSLLLPYPFTILEMSSGGSLDFLNRMQPFALLVMRLVLGAIMIAHGYHKVWGGFHHHMDFVGSLGLPKWLAYLSAGTEFFGGIAIVLGLFTRFFAAAFLIEMAVAIWKVHFKNGLMGNGGYEFPLALATIAFGLMCFGGGPGGATFGKSGGWKAR